MLKKNLEDLLEKWNIKEKTYKRDIEDKILPYISNKNAVFLYGPRRAGKSVVARRILERMPKDTTTRYINFEDPKLLNLLNTDLMNEFAKGLKPKDTIVFDEVQLIDGWEKWVRKAVAQRKCQVIVTGSSAKLLSSEFSTALGGRAIGFKILPFSFKEYCRVTKKDFETYMGTGGYPEVALNPNKKEKLLESYFETALIKDIITRYKIRDSAALRNLAFYLLTNSGKQISLKKIRNTLGLSYDTIRQFLEYLEDSFLVFQVYFFSYSFKHSLIKPRKIYAYDVGMQQYASKSFTNDKGRLAETLTAIELKNRNYEIYYWEGKNEVDFISKKKIEIHPINVCYSKKLPERENKGLVEFCKKYKTNKATILSLGKAKKQYKDNIEIENQNLQKWFLQKDKN